MGLFDHFPYTNVHELNLDWVLSMMKALEAKWDAFTAGNSLTFADPMLHDVTKTYAKNTIVLDGNGNAYVSLQAVPVGVGLQNGDYWLMVFDYEAFIEKVNKNFTARYYRGSYRATDAMAIGDWLTVDDVLCKATAAIAADDVLELGVNIEHFTLEDFIKAFMTSANQMIQQYKNEIDASEYAYRQQLAGDIANTTASLQAQLDAAIAGATVDSEVINARVGADGVTYPTLGDAIRTQFNNAAQVDESMVIRVDIDSASMHSEYIDIIPEWENGGLGLSNGVETSYTTDYRFKHYYKFDNPIKVSLFISSYGSYTIRYVKYKMVDGLMTYEGYGIWSATNRYRILDTDLDCYYRFFVENGNTGETTIDTSCVDHIFFRMPKFNTYHDDIIDSNTVIDKVDIGATITPGTVGITSTWAGRQHIEFPASEGEVYYISGFVNSNFNNYPLLIAYDSNDVIIDCYGNVEGGISDYRYVVPANTAKIIVNGADTYDGSIFYPVARKEVILGCNHISVGTSTGVGIGDSLMEGVGILRGDSAKNPPEFDVVSQMKPLLNCTLYNAGIGGGTYSTLTNNNFTEIVDAIISGDWTVIDQVIADAITQTDKHNGLLKQFAAIKALDFDDVDFIFINYGTNDWNSGAALDNPLDPYDKTTALGALRYGVDALLTAYPQLKIYVFTPLFRVRYDNDHNILWNSDTAVRGSDSLTLRQYAAGIVDGCESINLPVKNMYNSSNINLSNMDYYYVDGTHGNKTGYKLMADKYSKFILAE